MTGLLALIGWVAGTNLTGYPARFEDEGTYIAQAWAMQYLGTLSHYTYWYDHPFAGWAQLAAWTASTWAFERYESAITAGREFMLVAKLVSCALLYLLARRLGMRRTFAGAAVLLFALSPLAVVFQRYVLLDNVATPWLLAAFALALTPRRHVGAITGSAICMAIAALSKETSLLVLPLLVWQLCQHSDQRNRRYHVAVFAVVFTMVAGCYILYAALKSEFFEGPGHVSLLGAIKWQLFERVGTGNIFELGSGAHGLATLWLGLDTWLLALGAALAPVALMRRQLRPIAGALLVHLLMPLRGGYLPFPFIVVMLPFAALVIAGVVDWLWAADPFRLRIGWRTQLRRATAVLGLVALLAVVTPEWYDKTRRYTTEDADRSSRQTITWIDQNIPRHARIVIDSALWVDLVQVGFTNPRAVWLYKTETDPEVAGEIGGRDGIDYIIVSAPTLDPKNRPTFPTVFEAKDHAEQVASFGRGADQLLILKVDSRS